MASRTSQNSDAEKEIQYSPRSIEDTAEVSLTSPYVSTAGLSEPLQSFHFPSQSEEITDPPSRKRKLLPRRTSGNISTHEYPPVTIQGIDLERVSSVKLLGIIINNKLT